VLGKHLRFPIGMETHHLIGVGRVRAFHARRAERHAGGRDPDRRRALGEQTPDVASRDMAFDDIAADLGGMTGGQCRGHPGVALGLPPFAYVASEATTALAMHGAKTVLYLQSLSFEQEFWSLAAGMSLAMLLGTWAAKRIIGHLSRERFQGSVSLLLAMLAADMLVHDDRVWLTAAPRNH